MNVNSVIAFLKIHKLSSLECHSVMNALVSQENVVTGSLVTKNEIDYIADATCDQEDIEDKDTIKKVQKKH